MSSHDPASDGTFAVLDAAPEPTRKLFIEHRSKEELVAIVLAVWRQKDEAKARPTDAAELIDPRGEY